MTRSDLFQKAHQLTREDMRLYSNINYRVQFGLNLKYLYIKKDMGYKEKLDFILDNLNRSVFNDKFVESKNNIEEFSTWYDNSFEDYKEENSSEEYTKLLEDIDFVYKKINY